MCISMSVDANAMWQNKKQRYSKWAKMYWMIWCMAMVIWPLSLSLFFLLLLLWMSQQCECANELQWCSLAYKSSKINESLSFRTDYAQQESESLWITEYIRCNGERWASPYFAATVTSERTENKSARQSERGRCIQVHIHNKNVQWVSGCCVNCAGACIHILNSWRCTIAYFVYLSWISWNENTNSISKHTVPFHSLSPITIIIIFS